MIFNVAHALVCRAFQALFRILYAPPPSALCVKDVLEIRGQY